MRYMLLLYEREATWAGFDDAERDRQIAAYRRIHDEHAADGRVIAAEPLAPVATATSVRVGAGGTDVQDGPFAETREQLGGFYLIECDDLDDAIAVAEQLPCAATGTVEIRPIGH